MKNETYTNNRSLESKGLRQVKTYIDRVGFTAPIVLQGVFQRSQKSIQDDLMKLHLMGHIIRPLKGLVISTKWAIKNRGKTSTIEKTYGITIPIPKEY